MHIESVELRELRIPLVSPFTTSFSTQLERNTLVLKVSGTTDGPNGPVETVGWGECGSLSDPYYNSEYTAGARAMLREYLVPTLRKSQSDQPLTAETVGSVLHHVVGHQMSKSAIEMAILDAELRARGQSFARYSVPLAREFPRECPSASRTASLSCSRPSATICRRVTCESS